MTCRIEARRPDRNTDFTMCYLVLCAPKIFSLFSTFGNLKLSGFSIQDDTGYGVQSNHSSLVWELNLSQQSETRDQPTQNPLRRIKNWPSFTKILDQRFDLAWSFFGTYTCAEQGEFIKHQFQVAGTSVSPGEQHSVKNKAKTSLKMKTLLKQSKAIKKNSRPTYYNPHKFPRGGNQNQSRSSRHSEYSNTMRASTQHYWSPLSSPPFVI